MLRRLSFFSIFYNFISGGLGQYKNGQNFQKIREIDPRLLAERNQTENVTNSSVFSQKQRFKISKES